MFKVATGRDEKPLPPWFQPGGKGLAEDVSSEAGDGSVTAALGTAEDGSAQQETLFPERGAAGNSDSDAATDGVACTSTDGTEPVVELQAILDKLSHDTWEALEKAPPPGLLGEDPWFKVWEEAQRAVQGEGVVANSGDITVNVEDSGGVSTGGVSSGGEAAGETILNGSTETGNLAENGAGTETKAKQSTPKKGGRKVAPAPAPDTKGTNTKGASTTKKVSSAKGKGNKVSPL
mmetsp:Transcript_4748/g.8112  ORF Transcript_4748/g.8112 Transcript_4748/m.8112 type:complete len:234 (+) Transcript_4748:26-727(+)